MASSNLLTQRDEIRRQVEALEQCLDTDGVGDSIDISDSDEESEDGEQQALGVENLMAKREQIQSEIRELELTLSRDMAVLSQDNENGSGGARNSSEEDSDEELALPSNAETCLQMNLVYQDILEEKLTELERLLVENQEQQKEVMVQLSGPAAPQATSSGLPPLKVFLGNFMKPYFKDKVTGLGPPANPETRDKMSKGTRNYDEMKIRRWEGWQKTLMLKSIVNDTMKRMLQPKLSKVAYLNEKMTKTEDMEKQILQKQIKQIEEEIEYISSMSDEQLMGSRYDDHDWEKISNIDFEGTRSSEDIRRFWENYLHPSINKSPWKEDEIEQLKGIVEEKQCCNWDEIAEELGTNRTAFMCLQTHQRYINKGFKKRVWSKEEDQVLKELVERMRIGNFIPYTQISYFMEGREAGQLVYRWTQVLDPTLRKGNWTKEEDEMLLKAVAKYGVRDWWKIRNEVPGRNDGQCRDRYLDCLRADVKKGRWNIEEELMLIKLVEKYGAGRWSKIASEIPNRIDSQCLQKWKILTGRGYKSRKRVEKLPPRKMKKVKRIKREEEDMITTSEEDEIVYMGSEDELPKDQPDVVVEVREEYILPRMDLWIPKKFGPHFGLRSVKVVQPNLTDPKDTPENVCSDNGLSSTVSSTGVRTTILDRLGFALNNNMEKDSPLRQVQKDKDSETNMISLSLTEVKNLLLWNRRSQTKQRQRIKKGRLKTNKDSESEAFVQDQGMSESCQPQDCIHHPTSNLCRTCCTTFNDELLLAITPWVGNLLMPLACQKDEYCKVDVVREKTESTGLRSTPVFSFFLNSLSIDTEGCKKVIEARKKFSISQQGCKPLKGPTGVKIVTPPPRISPPPAPSDKPTVAMMLYEKRKQDYMKRKEDQRKKEAQKNGQFVVPYMVIPQSMVITQPLLQGIQPAAAPSATTTKSMDRGSAPQTQKRIRKRTEKARALISVPELKGAKSSPKNKKACSQRICMKDEKNEVISQVPLSQPPPITCIVTSNGLLPSGGLGISVANQVPPQGMKPLTSNVSFVASPKSVAIKQNNSLITPINTAKGAESPSTVLYVTPNHSILVNPPPSVIGERTSSGLTTPTSIATNTNSKTSICSNSAGPIHSAAPLNSVHVLPFNKKHAHISSHCTTKPVRKILPAPASGNTGFSVTIPKNSISQNVTPFSPILQQSLPIFQICQPQIPRIIANTSVNPVVLPTPPASPSQQPTVHLLNSNSPVPKPAVSTSHRPGHAINFDPNLISIGEEVSQVKEWMNGRGGVMHSQLDISLPYLPPFVSSLTTLTTLLKCKADLKMCSLPLIYSTGESSREEDPEKAIRQLVAERLSNNPAYLLLKARFLSCFSLPAFLATVPPHRDSSKIILSQYSEEEEEMSPREHSDKGILKGDLLRTDGQGAVASEFSGIGTRQRNRNLNGQ